MIPPIPTDEAERLAALREVGILDTPPEERFDRVTRLATYIFAVPVSLVTLVDATRQWFKSRQGFPVPETPREFSFCAHAILGNDALVVPDAMADERFSDNPLVLGVPNIRFYAGQPLTAPDGSRIGTLCIIDRRPRHLADEDVQVLKDLAAIVQGELALATYAGELAVRAFQNEKLAALGRLAAGIGHELKNPLTVITGRVDLLARQIAQSGMATAEDLVRDVERIGEAAARMRRIMESLSAYSKPVKPEPTLLDVAELLVATKEVIAYEARKSGVSVVIEAPDVLPKVRGDRSQLMQIFVNLATNGIQAMAEAGGGELRLRARVEAHRLRIDVTDTGSGIPENLRAKIWEPFYTTKAEGTGLGLSIVRGLVAEQPGATLEMDSQPGVGTSFTLTMPVAS